MTQNLKYVLWFGLAAVFAAFLWLGPSRGTEPAAPAFPKGSLTIKHVDGSVISFSIEVARTPAETSYGLMFRRSLPEDSGMLFLFSPPQVITMWMKNTYIPLDMLFIRKDGTIEKIVTHTVPFSLDSISSEEPVEGVIEIGDGVAAKKGVKTGDKVLYPAFTLSP